MTACLLLRRRAILIKDEHERAMSIQKYRSFGFDNCAFAAQQGVLQQSPNERTYPAVIGSSESLPEPDMRHYGFWQQQYCPCLEPPTVKVSRQGSIQGNPVRVAVLTPMRRDAHEVVRHKEASRCVRNESTHPPRVTIGSREFLNRYRSLGPFRQRRREIDIAMV